MYLIIYAILLSLAIWGSIIIPGVTLVEDVRIELKIYDLVNLFIVFLVVMLAVCVLMKILDWIEKKPRKHTSYSNGIWAFPSFFASILICWTIVFLDFYPGNLCPDSYSSINQALGTITSNAHPMFFTLIVRACLKLGLFLFDDMNAAVAVFSVSQMVLMALVCAYFVYWCLKHGFPKWMILCCVAYYALNPLIARYSFTMWKDTLFSGVLLLTMLTLHDLIFVEHNSKKAWIAFCCFTVLLSFLRNRIIYAVIVLYVVLIVLFWSKKRILIPAFALISAIMLLIQGPAYKALNIRESNFAETQGIALQQIAGTVVDEGVLSSDQLQLIEQFVPIKTIKEVYNPYSVDGLKGDISFQADYLNAHKSEFLQLWAELFSDNVGSYIKAWAKITRGFWGFNTWRDPFAITWENEELGIHQVHIMKTLTGIDLEQISNGILVHMKDIPVIRCLFDIGYLAWITLFYAVRLCQKKRWKQLLPILPMVFLWIVLLMTTPVAHQPRYMFVFFLGIPYVFIHLLSGEKPCVNRTQIPILENRHHNP